jgi:hypothetical protein
MNNPAVSWATFLNMKKFPFTVTLNLAALFVTLSFAAHGEVLPGSGTPPIQFKASTIDAEVAIGYGIALEDMNADGTPDVILQDKSRLVWYENPTWNAHVVVENLTERDHVCLAARDIDGDGMAELAAGAGWKPWDTLGADSGYVAFMIRPEAGPEGEWLPHVLPHDPTTHRMRWVKSVNGFILVAAPLHGRGSGNGEGPGARILAYHPPKDPRSVWPVSVIEDDFSQTHNIDPVQWDDDPEEEILLTSREGVFLYDAVGSGWKRSSLIGGTDFAGASEARLGRLGNGKPYIATIEPFHGNQVVVYQPSANNPDGHWNRQVLDSDLNQGHALATGEALCSASGDFLFVGWRNPNGEGKVGVRYYAPGVDGTDWTRWTLDDNTMACEDIRLADLNDDGLLDVVAAGRSTNNLKIYVQSNSVE